MKHNFIFITLSFILLAFAFSPLLHANIISTNDINCSNHTLISSPYFCDYNITIPSNLTSVGVDVYTSGQFNSTPKVNYVFDDNAYFSVWIDQSTLPIYITVNDSNLQTIDSLSLGKSTDWSSNQINLKLGNTNITKTYKHLDRNTNKEIYYLAWIFIILGLFFLFFVISRLFT